MSKIDFIRAAAKDLCAASSSNGPSIGLHNQFDKAHDGIETAAPTTGNTIFRDNHAAPELKK